MRSQQFVCPPTSTTHRQALTRAGVKVRIGSVVNLLDTQIALVEAEEGIAIIPHSGCRRAATERW